MAFDQNQILKDLQQLNIAQAVPADETRIAQPATASRNVETFFPNSPAVDVGSPGSGARVIYQATGSDGGFVGLGYPNAVACVAPQRSSQVPVAIGHGGPAVGFNYAHNLGNWVAGNTSDQASSDMSPGFVYNANLVNRAGASPTEVSSNTSASGFGCSPNTASHAGGSGIDHASEEGGDDSSSGKKVKILCSFGGKILPRPSDGMLRYVGGQTRIISVRRDTCFNELVQRMADAYGQPVVIKYQLPNEDLDALVSVSCGDDLENMMDEYEKLVERSPDGSSKLRVFLFSASEPDSPGSVEFTDLRDSGQKYVEAVNSIGDGGIMRKESGMSASTQNSDFSVTENVDSSGVGQSDAGASQSMGISPGGNLVTHPDTSTRHLGLDPNPVIPLVSNVMQHQQQQQPGVCISPSTNYMHTYVDPRQEVMSHAVLSSQMGFPNQLLGAGGSVYTQQQFHDNASGGSSQFTPGMHMTMTPSSSHVGMRPTMVQPLQTRLDCHPEESTFGARVVQLPFDQNYCTYQAQVPSTMIGGGYVLGPQTRAPDHVLFSDGLLPHQQVIIPEKVSRLEDCFMCQKSLPHAHSDASSQDDRDSVASPISDSNVVYHSPRFEENIRPWQQNRGTAVRAVGESTVEQGATARSRVIAGHQVGAARPETTGFPQNPEAQYETERIIFHKTDNLDHPGTSVPQGLMGYSGDMHSPQAQGVVMGGQQPLMPIQYQVKQEGLANKPVNTDPSPIVIMPSQTSKVVVQESPKEDIINKPQQAVGREGLVDTAFSQPHMILVQPHDKKMEVILPSNTEVSHVQNILPVESSEVAGSSNIGNSDPYCPSEIGIRHLDPVETRSKVVVSGVEPNYVIDKMPPVSEWKDESSRFHPKVVLEDVETFPLDGNMTSSSSASSSVRTCGSQNVSHSLFSNQDPWNRQQDPHLFLPRLNKIESEKESFYTPFGNNNLVNGGELLGEMMLEDRALHPSGNLDKDSNSNLFGPTKSEELVRQELEATAEGIAASTFQADTPSNPDLPVQKEDDCTSETNGEDINTNVPEKVNFGFPVSDGLGRLQIIRNSDLEELQELGSGTFGTVYHGKWRGTDVAIKRINHRCFSGKASEQERMRNDFWNEAIKLADLHHPNVVAFYGVVLDSPEGSVATVTEYMVNGSLRDALERNERNLDKRKRLLIAMDVAFGMEYLHGKNIVHFDLKSDNLLVNLRDHHRPICKVGDLGLSKVKCQTLISGGVRGTLPWMAPELLNGSSSLVSDKVDVFSFGIVLWELLTGEEPYADLHYGAIIGGIVSNTLRPAIPEWCDPEWRSMMERCWASEPPDRPNFTDIANGLRSIAAKLPLKGQPHHQHQVSSPTDTHFHK